MNYLLSGSKQEKKGFSFLKTAVVFAR